MVGGGGDNLERAYSSSIHELGLQQQVATHHGTSTGLMSAVRSGFGIAGLPCILGGDDRDLIRCLLPRRDHGRVMWLLTHDLTRHAPKVRVVIDFL